MSIRLPEKNKIYAEVASLEKNIIRCEQTTQKLMSGGIKDQTFIQKSLKETNDKILEDKQKIQALKDRLIALDNGELDCQISQEVSVNTKKVVKKMEEINKKKIEEKKLKKEGQQKTQEQYKSNKNSDFSNRQKEYDMNKAYERFMSIELPSHMTENLRNMPQNKGYIFKNVWFFGELSIGKNQPLYPLVMFENRGGGVKVIHEIYDNEHLIFTKFGDNRKELEQRIPRISKK